MKTAYVIPTYNKPELVEQCVQSLLKTQTSNFKVIVVEDGSERFIKMDNTSLMREEKKFGEKVRVEWYCLNMGYAFACNTGIKKALTWGADLVVLVNNDVVFTKGFYLEPAFEDSSVGIVGGLLFYPDGRVQHGGGKTDGHFFGHRGHGMEKRLVPGCFKPLFVPYNTGALLAVRREVFEKIGFLSEDFGITYEDTDFCLRAWEAGFKVKFDPLIEAIHEEGATRGKTEKEKSEKRPDLLEKEKKADGIFRQKWSPQRIDKVLVRVKEANEEKYDWSGKIAVRRTWALGDVIKASEFTNSFEGKIISIITSCPDVFRHVLNIKEIVPMEEMADYDALIDLDQVYERNPEKNYSECFETQFLKIKLNPVYAPHVVPVDECDRLRVKLGGLPEEYVVFHLTRKWKGKSWAKENYENVAKVLGLQVVCVGDPQIDEVIETAIDTRGKATLQEMKVIIENAKLFVGMDTGIAHLAMTTKTPCAVMFTVADPKKVLSPSQKCEVIIPEMDCQFCLHTYEPPVNYCDCKFGHFDCLKKITPEKVLQACRRAMNALDRN